MTGEKRACHRHVALFFCSGWTPQLGKVAATPSPLQPGEGADRAGALPITYFLSAVVADSGGRLTMTGERRCQMASSFLLLGEYR